MFISITGYAIAHWIFAFKYLMLSYLITGLSTKFIKRLNVGVIVGILVSQFIVALIFIIDELKNVANVVTSTIFYVLLFTNVVFNLMSCLALQYAFKKISSLK